MQVAVLGDAGCGKTSLLRAILGWEFDPESPPTEARTSYRAQVGSDPNDDVLVLVDCGPVDDEISLRNLLRGVSCVVLCFDCSSRQSFESIRSVWLDAVRAACWEQNVSFVLAGCKADDPHREIGKSEVETYAIEQNIYLIETSARLGTNIDLLTKVLLIRQPARVLNKPPSPVRGYQHSKPTDPATTLRIHRTGSVDLSAKASGLDFHVSRDGSVIPNEVSRPAVHSMLNGHGRFNDEPADVETFPLMIDVKMAGGNIGTIILNSFRDDPLALADAFLRRHGLDTRRAPELARVVQNRLDEYFAGPAESSQAPFSIPRISRSPAKSPLPPVIQAPSQSTRVKATSPAKAPGAILARLNVFLADGTTTVVAVREGDDVGKLVEAFRRTYGVSKDDALLGNLAKRITDVLKRGAHDENSDVLSPSRGTSATSPTVTAAATIVAPPTIAVSQTQQQVNPAGLDLAQIENLLKLSDTQKQILLRALGVSVTDNLGPTITSSPQRPTNGVHSIAPPPPQPDTYALEDHRSHSSLSVEEQETQAPQMASPQLAPKAQSSRPVESTPALRHPPPPPPSKYINKFSPVPYRASQSPSMRSVVTTSPVGRASTATGGSAPSLGTLRRVGRPLFFVDVELGGKADRIAVHKGDNLKEVAEAFLEANNISKTKTLKLTQLLEYNMRLHQKNRKQGM